MHFLFGVQHYHWTRTSLLSSQGVRISYLNISNLVVLKYSYISSETFKSISYYVIPNKELCGKLNVLRLEPGLYYMGLPVEILNEKKY